MVTFDFPWSPYAKHNIIVHHFYVFIENHNSSLFLCFHRKTLLLRGGSRAAATSKMECFVITVNGWKSLTIITKHSILDVAAALDPPVTIARNHATESLASMLKNC